MTTLIAYSQADLRAALLCGAVEPAGYGPNGEPTAYVLTTRGRLIVARQLCQQAKEPRFDPGNSEPPECIR